MTDTLTGTGKLASAGKPEPMSGIPGSAPQPQATASTQAAPAPTSPTSEATAPTEEVPGQTAAQPAAGTTPEGVTVATPELTKEQIKELYEKNFPAESQPTEEEKNLAEKELEKRMADLYIAQGGKGEDFYKIKEVLSMDLTTLSQAQLTEEMKAAGFSDEEITAVRTERYYQLNPDELEQGIDEEDVDFEKRKASVAKKVAYGTAKLQKKGEHIKTDAQEIFNTLKEAIKNQDLQTKQAAEFTAKVDEVVKAIPSKVSVELGKLNDTDLGSVETDVTDAEKAEIGAILRDPAQLNKILYTDSGSVNVQEIARLLLIEKMHMKSAREALLEGQTRQVREFRKTFPVNNPAALGVRNGSSSGNGGSGRLVSAGKPQVVNPAQRVAK